MNFWSNKVTHNSSNSQMVNQIHPPSWIKFRLELSASKQNMQTKETAIVRHKKSRRSYTAIFCDTSEYLCKHET